MPKVFRTMATLAVWILFLFGILRLLIGLVVAFSSGPDSAPLEAYLDFLVGTGSITLSVVVMRLRKMLE